MVYIEKSCGPARDGAWTAELDPAGAERIVVGTGPGSYAGVRAAIAFATGYSVGSGCEVLGLPSPCAVAGAADAFPLAVVGDARMGMRWLALFDGGERGAPEVRLLSEAELKDAVPSAAKVVSSDHARIGESLAAAFGDILKSEEKNGSGDKSGKAE